MTTVVHASLHQFFFVFYKHPSIFYINFNSFQVFKGHPFHH